MSAAGGIGWAVEALIASSLLMAFVLAVRRPAQRALGPQLAYWLWALPALRLALPPLPAAWRESAAAPISAASETVLVYIAPAAAGVAPDPAAAALPWLALFAAAWALGALAFFAWHGAAHVAYVRRILAPPARHAALSDGTTLVESDHATGPVAFGILRRFVAVPRDFAERYDADERRLALAHELGHHARGDLVANWIGLAVLAAHWFNPLAWVAYRKFRCDQEMANDARVLAALPARERHAYACAILKAASGRAVTAACHLHTIEDLKGRLRMLKADRKSRRVLLAGAGGLVATAFAALGLTASGAAAEQLRTAAAVQVPLLARAAPAVPAAPAAPTPEAIAPIVIERAAVAHAAAPAAAPAPVLVDGRIPGQRVTQRIVIRTKDGRTERYEGAAADAYLAAHPDALPPLPPVPPQPLRITRTGNGLTAFLRRPGGTTPDGKPFVTAPLVVSADCGKEAAGVLTATGKEKDGRTRIVICQNRIASFADMQARFDRLRALDGLRAGRAAIEGNRALSEAQRAQALAGLDQARAAIEAEPASAGK